MRSLAVLALATALFLSTDSACQGAVSGSAHYATAGAARPSDGGVAVPLLAPFLLMGYISMGLKRQLGRRGYAGDRRDQGYSDLIFLRRKDPAPPAADDRGADEPRRRHSPSGFSSDSNPPR